MLLRSIFHLRTSFYGVEEDVKFLEFLNLLLWLNSFFGAIFGNVEEIEFLRMFRVTSCTMKRTYSQISLNNEHQNLKAKTLVGGFAFF